MKCQLCWCEPAFERDVPKVTFCGIGAENKKVNLCWRCWLGFFNHKEITGKFAIISEREEFIRCRQ